MHINAHYEVNSLQIAALIYCADVINLHIIIFN